MQTYIEMLNNRHNLNCHPYFVALQKSHFEKDDFIETQIQVYFVLSELAKPLQSLSRRVPQAKAFLTVLSEHIDADEGGRSQSKADAVKSLLAQQGIEQGHIEKKALWPEAKAFISALSGVCSSGEFYTSVAALSMIESFYHASRRIENKVAGLRQEESSDECTPNDMMAPYQVLQSIYGQDQAIDYQIEQGLEFGAYLWVSLYQGLYDAKKRRYGRSVTTDYSGMTNH